MSQEFEAKNYTDDKGAPSGGFVKGVGLDIQWQNGALGRGENRKVANGTDVETVITAAIQRLQQYQDSPLKCRQNALMITHLEEALHWAWDRTREREKRKVEGTHLP